MGRPMLHARINALRRRLVTTGMAVVLAVATVTFPAQATIQEESCVEPDIEYPVPCED